MDINQDIKKKSESALHHAYARLVNEKRWRDYPMIVSIETYSKCNARCTFCPYTELDRQNTKLPADIVMRLLDEVATFAVHPARVNLSRVNEPFLDSNLFSYLDYASRILPKTELVLFSNGQALTDAVIDRLNALPMFRRLTISCNESDPVRYREVMGLDWDKTQPRIANLHQRYQAGTVRFDVSLSRVGTSTEADKAFLAWAKEVYPEFPAASHARFDWVGKETEGDAKRQLSFAPDAGCVQWFSLHILSDGNSAFCCIDGHGADRRYSIAKHGLLDIYNDPFKRRLRETVISRHDVPGCSTCRHGMPSNAYVAGESTDGIPYDRI